MKPLVLLILAACEHGQGGGIGAPSSTALVELDDMQAAALCQQAGDLVTERTVTCGDSSITVSFTTADCLNQINSLSPGCEATVDDMLDCARAFETSGDREICEGFRPEECAPLDRCAEIQG